ncbi:hypothetical protein TMatcc_008305 [Talaromyces marneffei ATCC 18224]
MTPSLKYASFGGNFNSKINRSTLLTTRVIGISSNTAYLMICSVFAWTPSTTSTTSATPSAKRRDAATSSTKLT